MGLLSCGNGKENPQERKTYFSKLTRMQKDFSLQGFYAPISLPQNIPTGLRLAISSFLPDGMFLQKKDLSNKPIRQITKELGVEKIIPQDSGSGTTYTVDYTDTFITNMPYHPGDSGGLIMDKQNRLSGLIIAGSKNLTVAIPIKKVTKALELELVKLNHSSHYFVLRSSFWRTRCLNPDCAVIIPPNSSLCPFCGMPQNKT